MKILVTYEQADILKLIEKDLVSSGLKYDLASAKYKGTAKLTIEVEGTPGADPGVEAATPTNVAPMVEAPTPPAPRREEVPTPSSPSPLDTDPADMSVILGQSRKNATDNPGKFPAPPPRKMMAGESEEWPGLPPERGR